MLANSTTSEAINALSQRVEFLECVEGNAKDKRTLVDHLGCSRSTVDRGVRELEALHFLTYGDDGYKPTMCGQLAAKEYRRFEHRIETLCRLQPFLRRVPLSEFDIELEWITDAELLLPEPNDPYSMINRHVQLVAEAESGKALLPLAGLHAHEAGYDNVMERGGEIELVVTSGVAQMFRENPNYADLTEEMLATDRFELYEYEGQIPYAIVVLDDTVQLGVDEDGDPKALLETEVEDVRDWAEQKIESYKEQATKVTPSLKQ